MLNILEYPVIDSHCHAFLPENETDSFEQYYSLAFHKLPKEDVENTLFFRQAINELSRIMNIKGNYKEIIAERNKKYKTEPKDYIKRLFEDAKIETLLVDTGYPSSLYGGSDINIKDFERIIPARIETIFRIDNVLLECVRNLVNFNKCLEVFDEKVENAIKSGVVSLKTTAAYNTGLEINKNSEKECEQSYTNLLKAKQNGISIRELFDGTKDGKKVLDYFIYKSIEKSVKHKIPYQIHAGMGAIPNLDLRRANPILLHDLINDEVAKEAKLILVHGGYPYIEESGFLVNTYPNVYLDMSETIPHISIGIKEKLLNLLEMAPINKIMYGSDGYTTPEQFWISSILTKKALVRVTEELLLAGLDEGWIENFVKKFLSKNAEKIYNL
jgi:predicted TIM-barrel fold metal-dependent hydrolase